MDVLICSGIGSRKLERRSMENELFEQTSVPKAYLKLAFPVVMSMMVSLV